MIFCLESVRAFLNEVWSIIIPPNIFPKIWLIANTLIYVWTGSYNFVLRRLLRYFNLSGYKALVFIADCKGLGILTKLLICTAWKVSVFGVILVRIFLHSDQNMSEYGHFSRSAELCNFSRSAENLCLVLHDSHVGAVGSTVSSEDRISSKSKLAKGVT